jgi:DNA-binding HxlR family transcriptional regulator
MTKSNSDIQVTTLKITPTPTHECKKAIMGVHDAMYILGGKWKIHLIAALLFGPKRYSDLLRDIYGISGKVLSRELKEMEINRLVKRTVSSTQSITVIYELTEYGKSTQSIITVLAEWGDAQRQVIIKDTQS